MKVVERNSLRRGGFAGLRETRLVMSPRLFRTRVESGTSPGLGRFVYLSDTSFLPKGDTRMHTHQEVDVISVMVQGRIRNEGSLQDGQELKANMVQVQRAGNEGFRHNETNPDDDKNRLIQIWVLPEKSEECASCKTYQAKQHGRTRIYGGPADQDETFASRTMIEIAHLNEGEVVEQPGRSLAYITRGAGSSEDKTLREGHLVDTRDFKYKALSDSQLILVYEN
jgi:redox-sensitive bicupin YhaK (pirin superfamily)